MMRAGGSTLRVMACALGIMLVACGDSGATGSDTANGTGVGTSGPGGTGAGNAGGAGSTSTSTSTGTAGGGTGGDLPTFPDGPAAGNPNGNCAVPAEAGLEDVSSPTTVVGDGTAASCTSAAVVAAVAAGGVITFDCGPDPVTIAMEETAKIFNDKGPKIVLDGGGLVTLDGGGLSSIGVSYTVLNSLFSDNQAIGDGANPAQPGTPGDGSGGAIYNDGNTYTLTLCGVDIHGNTANEGGGAIFFVSNDQTGTLVIRDSTLTNNPSLGFETYPGIFYIGQGDPVLDNSTIQ